jgi:putative effector of murein hydrolase LrgA (UPF0299 family)
MSKIWDIIVEVALIFAIVNIGFYLQTSWKNTFGSFIVTLGVLFLAVGYKVYFSEKKK